MDNSKNPPMTRFRQRNRSFTGFIYLSLLVRRFIIRTVNASVWSNQPDLPKLIGKYHGETISGPRRIIYHGNKELSLLPTFSSFWHGLQADAITETGDSCVPTI